MICGKWDDSRCGGASKVTALQDPSAWPVQRRQAGAKGLCR